MGYFVAILRERIAKFEAPATALTDTDSSAEVNVIAGISINDIRKNLSLLNDFMEADCRSSEARYGVVLDASLIRAIDSAATLRETISGTIAQNGPYGAYMQTAATIKPTKPIQKCVCPAQ